MSATGALRVGVFGAGGRMGRAICSAVNADPDLELVAAVDPAYGGAALEGLGVGPGPEAMADAGVQVAVDFTVAPAVMGNASWCAEHAVHLVIGTTGLGEDDVARLGAMFASGRANCIMSPNFAIGAVLMMRFAELAAPWFDTVEIIELHHDGKLDAPSGTAAMTARRVSAAIGHAQASATGDLPRARGFEAAPGVRVHSVRLRGLVAHQEVLLGAAGQALTIRHDSLDRSSFLPGILLAVKQVPKRPGLTVGLEALLEI